MISKRIQQPNANRVLEEATTARRELEAARATISEMQVELDAARRLLDAPELHDFAKGCRAEAAHQRSRWGSAHDAGKAPADWFWLVGYLAGKALAAHIAGNVEKALHHTISTAGALANWHAAILGKTDMRPGIDVVGAQSGGTTAQPKEGRGRV